jgi:signal transduction histidine kinase
VTVNFGEIGRNRVEFVVTDTGRGIPSELLPKIFDIFYQEDASQGEYASAGLGLNIVKRLVSAMSGEITVTSEVGKGSTFRVILPTAIELPAAHKAQSS